jgi:hypothetical protein
MLLQCTAVIDPYYYGYADRQRKSIHNETNSFCASACPENCNSPDRPVWSITIWLHYMDWTMVGNADDKAGRLRTLVYLFRIRYEVDAQTAGIQLRREPPGNQLCRLVLDELRAELASPSVNLGVGSLVPEAEAREYLSAALCACDDSKNQ